jgi:hypothetical protein
MVILPIVKGEYQIVKVILPIVMGEYQIVMGEVSHCQQVNQFCPQIAQIAQMKRTLHNLRNQRNLRTISDFQ